MIFKNYRFEETIRVDELGGGLGKRNFGNLKYPTKVPRGVVDKRYAL